MALIVCPLCVREDDVHLVRTLEDGRKEARCDDCDFAFVYGAPVEPKKVAAPRKRTSTARVAKPVVVPIAVVAKRFPLAGDVDPAAQERADRLKQEFLAAGPWEPSALVAPHWTKYRWVFSADGLEKVAIADLKYFADSPIGGSTGDPTVFDKAWVLLGEFEAARRIRATTTHLLRGSGDLEDRLTTLVDGSFAQSMPGWDEALLTKTLAVAEAYRFVPIVTYDEKRAIALAVYGIELPVVDEVSLTIGRLAVWSNDLLVELAGDGFDDLHHTAAFLRWAATQH
ncbi:hypothetical protein [Aeromicrobium fastidiosum]|uniref:Uncharacterized protein n=1 Tax=Aeromicrobium fastidiosum TaxID=52699 RepID=A0A641ANP2_9ACTN|nr:hypothetical protein [Aeromicrobium fastidiosum]KAA1376422.1 hypothetical protein ESP62_013420 [Aeromicrobium fastidiosum]MBP2391665.1 hypothetical protein [Aeromicrobium fastidiosum]